MGKGFWQAQNAKGSNPRSEVTLAVDSNSLSPHTLSHLTYWDLMSFYDIPSSNVEATGLLSWTGPNDYPACSFCYTLAFNFTKRRPSTQSLRRIWNEWKISDCMTTPAPGHVCEWGHFMMESKDQLAVLTGPIRKRYQPWLCYTGQYKHEIRSIEDWKKTSGLEILDGEDGTRVDIGKYGSYQDGFIKHNLCAF